MENAPTGPANAPPATIPATEPNPPATCWENSPEYSVLAVASLLIGFSISSARVSKGVRMSSAEVSRPSARLEAPTRSSSIPRGTAAKACVAPSAKAPIPLPSLPESAPPISADGASGVS